MPLVSGRAKLPLLFSALMGLCIVGAERDDLGDVVRMHRGERREELVVGRTGDAKCGSSW